MTRAEYYRLCLQMPVTWLRECAACPSPGMRHTHVLLVRLAIRRIEEGVHWNRARRVPHPNR